MTVSRHQLCAGWRTAALGVLLMWVICRGACIAGPVFWTLCCEHDSGATVAAESMHDHEGHNHDHGGQDHGSDYPVDSNHHQSDESRHGGAPASPSADTECCDSEALLSSASYEPPKNHASLQFDVTWLFVQLLLADVTDRHPGAIFESPPPDLQTLSLLLLGPGHLPNGPPLL